jgi:hypothetical protein
MENPCFRKKLLPSDSSFLGYLCKPCVAAIPLFEKIREKLCGKMGIWLRSIGLDITEPKFLVEVIAVK